MKTTPKHTMVVIPNEQKLDVSYFCSDTRIKNTEKKDFTDLIIQLDDCHCSYKISKNICGDENELERIVQKTVINAKGHLC